MAMAWLASERPMSKPPSTSRRVPSLSGDRGRPSATGPEHRPGDAGCPSASRCPRAVDHESWWYWSRVLKPRSGWQCQPPTTTVSVAETSDVVTVASPQPRPAVRRWTRRLVPVAACLVVAAIGFFSVIWLMTPRWTVADISQQLARIDFTTLDTLREFGGDPKASQLPDPAWQKLDWTCHKIAKGWPDAGRHQFAVYGFVLPGRQRHPVRGLLAVIPRGQMRSPPGEQSVLTAQRFGDYLSAQIGESVSVAWTENDLVYVCVIEGGGESLSTLTQILGPSAA